MAAANGLSLDAIGQRDEVVRQRIGVMLDRLDDLKTLQDDFSAIIQPLVGISAELPRATARVAELEVSLTQERQAASVLRQEGQEYVSRLAGLGQELSVATARFEKAEIDLRDHEKLAEERRISLRDKGLALENLERQLFAETEQSKALAGECKALRAEAQAADTALSRSEHDLSAARERVELLDQDNRRLQVLSEEQASQLAELQARLQEFDVAADAMRLQQRTIEERLAAETAARERIEARYETEVGGYRSERAGLAMKLEAQEHRASTAEQLLSQVRSQLHEKDEAHRAADRMVKEATIARKTVERRFESLQADMARQSERFLELQRANAEFSARCDMLTKALAARDVLVEQTTARNETLAERMDQLIAKHESARAELGLTNRRLAEDLENERSERALVQGALAIARESRVTLQKQHEALKRSGRGWRHAAAAEAGKGSVAEGEETSNVHVFALGKAN